MIFVNRSTSPSIRFHGGMGADDPLLELSAAVYLISGRRGGLLQSIKQMRGDGDGIIGLKILGQGDIRDRPPKPSATPWAPERILD
jgi:hypothetical protein